MRHFKLESLATSLCMTATVSLFAVLCAADGPKGAGGLGAVGSTEDVAPVEQQIGGGDAVEVTVTGTVFFNGIGDPPLSDVQAGDAGTCSFLVHTNNFMDGASNTRGYAIDQSSFVLTLGSVEMPLANPFPDGQTPYFTLADGIPVSDRFWVSISPNSPGGVPLMQDPFNMDVDLGYSGETLNSLDILDALGTYDFGGLTSFSFNLWAFSPDNVALGLDFQSMTIAEADDGDGSDKVTICHIPPGNPDNAHTITVSVNALAAHLAHGDTIGECDDGGGGCQSNDECGDNEYCAKAVGDCDGEGVCTVRPEFCTTEYDPVCGCDGNTYPNACSAAAAGVNVAFFGECEPLGRCCQGGFTGIVCLVNTEAECMSSGQFISWEEGLDCPDGDATCDDGGNPACGPGAGDCCANNGTAGCDDEECCNLICELDAFCCDNTWDQICADAAIANCESCFIPGPANDDCADAICIADGGVVNGSTAGSTGEDLTSCAFEDTNDVWYVTNYQGGLMNVSLCGSSYDTTLALFDACNGNELVCNDDSCGLQSEVSFEAIVGGFDVLIRVSGFNTATGDFTLNVTGGGGACLAPLLGGSLTPEQVYEILLPGYPFK